MFGCRYFYVTGNGRINIFPRYFLMELWGRMQYAPTLTDEKEAFSLSAVGRGMGGLVGAGFSESLDIVKLRAFFLCLFLLFLS